MTDPIEASNASSLKHIPPLSYVVFQESAEQTTPCSGQSILPCKGSFAERASICTVPANPFRLLPRIQGKCTPSPSARGRKRRANSLSSPADSFHYDNVAEIKDYSLGEDSLSTSSSKTNERGIRASPAERMHSTAVTFEGLSLASPNHNILTTQLAEPSPTSLVGSHTSLSRSSFSKYNAGVSSTGSTLLRVSPAGSYESPSIRSPRLAPVTVLAVNSNGSISTSKLPPRSNNQKQMFLSKHSTKTTGHAAVTADKKFSTPDIQKYPSSLRSASCKSLLKNQNVPFVGGATSSLSGASCTPSSENQNYSFIEEATTKTNQNNCACTEAQQSHVELLPSYKNESSDHFLEVTPLPRIALTPRALSIKNKNSALEGSKPLPMLPTEQEVEESNVAELRNALEFREPSYRLPNDPLVLQRPLGIQRETFIPLPEIGDNPVCMLKDENNEGISQCSILRQKYGGPSQSLLLPSTPQQSSPSIDVHSGNAIWSLSSHRHGNFENKTRDTDSLSASDDEDEDADAFYLVAPFVINEEKQANQEPKKYRKLSESFVDTSANLGTSVSRDSTTGLFGMDFLAFGTEKDHSLFPSRGVSNYCSEIQNCSEPSSFLANPTTSIKSFQTDKEAGSSSERDLITPPVLAPPQSPPLFSPQGNKYKFEQTFYLDIDCGVRSGNGKNIAFQFS